MGVTDACVLSRVVGDVQHIRKNICPLSAVSVHDLHNLCICDISILPSYLKSQYFTCFLFFLFLLPRVCLVGGERGFLLGKQGSSVRRNKLLSGWVLPQLVRRVYPLASSPRARVVF